MGFGGDDKNTALSSKEEWCPRSHLPESLEIRVRSLTPSDEAVRLLGRAGVIEPRKGLVTQILGRAAGH